MEAVEQTGAPRGAPVAASPGRPPRRARAGAGRFLALRAAQGLVVVIGAVLISFLLGNIGGSPVDRLGGFLTAEQRAALSHQLGYDRPVGTRLLEYLGRVSHGDFGQSINRGGSAAAAVLHALPATAALIGVAVAFSLTLAVLLASHSVLHRERPLDRAARGSLFVMQGMPEFFVGLMLVLIFAVNLQWLPSIGFDGPRSLILPALTLSVGLVPSMTRVLRNEMLDVMQQEFVTGLRARGLSARRIVVRHVLRNAAPPFVTILALQIGWLLGGTLIVESVFGWPGMGDLLFNASKARDITVVQAIVTLVAVGYVVVNLCADLLVVGLDPRTRLGGASDGR
jgi:peptide/nickel transport system permease protein